MTMSLLLKCGNLEETKAFYSGILAFDVFDSAKGTCTVRKSEGTMIFTEGNLWEGRPNCTGTIYFFVPDVDEYYRAIEGKAIVRWPLAACRA